MKNTNKNTQTTIIYEKTDEQWAKIPGHSRYLVSNSKFPVVWDTKKKKVCHVTKMRGGDGGNVYDYVNLRRDDDGSYHGVPLHRVAALAWIPNPHGYRVVDHIDDNPRNNAPANLRWVSDSANHSKPAAKNKMSRSMLAAWRDPIKRANMVAAQVRRRTRERTEKLLDGIASMIVDFRQREGLENA